MSAFFVQRALQIPGFETLGGATGPCGPMTITAIKNWNIRIRASRTTGATSNLSLYFDGS